MRDPITVLLSCTRRSRRAVAVAEHFRPFEQLAMFYHFIKARWIDEMVVTAVAFATAFRARRHRNGKLDVAVRAQQQPRQGCLSRARRRRQDQHKAPAADAVLISSRSRHRYSTF